MEIQHLHSQKFVFQTALLPTGFSPLENSERIMQSFDILRRIILQKVALYFIIYKKFDSSFSQNHSLIQQQLISKKLILQYFMHNKR